MTNENPAVEKKRLLDRYKIYADTKGIQFGLSPQEAAREWETSETKLTKTKRASDLSNNNQDNNLITRTGLALWGARWQSEMAAALNVREDTVQDWRQGRSSIPNGVLEDLLKTSWDRYYEIKRIIYVLGQEWSD